MDENNRNMLLAIVLSGLILVAWQLLYAGPMLKEQQERQKRIDQQRIEQTAGQNGGQTGSPPAGTAPRPGAPALPAAQALSREAALAVNPRIAIATPALKGSIALKGGRIDDLSLLRYKETLTAGSKPVVLFSPSGTAEPFYAEYGWVAGAGTTAKVPDAETPWVSASAAPLTPASPVILTYDNGQGLLFRRTISIDGNYMFLVRDEVDNKSQQTVSLFPYGLISRHGTPKHDAFWVQHEGLVGVLGADGLKEIKYDAALKDPPVTYKAKTRGWLGITDKYWAATLIPDQNAEYQGRFEAHKAETAISKDTYQADYLLNGVTLAPGAGHSVESHLFAGAKQVKLIEGYGTDLNIKQFDLLIDWGWFYFITKPMFKLLDFFNKLFGNFGWSILATTVLIKAVFFPLANKSYASMSKMKKMQPEMERIRERFKDDKMRQQQAMMDLYKNEKINPMSGCVPMLLQVPVFFALYKVILTTIEMRHAPFIGWIKDLSAADPTTFVNLFGLLPFAVPPMIDSVVHLGVWPLIMGFTMWVQMKLNPAPTDPVQEKVFAWMPVVFTFMLAPFAAGLVIYWSWNNLLGVIQQYVMMKKQGVDVPLMKNLGVDKLLEKLGVGVAPKSRGPAE